MFKKILSTIGLLFCSNMFMNTAWYAHLKFADKDPLYKVIVVSWGIAFFEYCFQVPANRISYGVLSVTQLKVMQEIITLVTFTILSVVIFKEKLTANHGLAFLCMVGAVYFAMKK